jgi:hypothetical protein
MTLRNKLKSISRKNKRQFIGILKTDIGCTDCGYNKHPDALAFDHLPEYEKLHNVARMISWDKDIGLILEEVVKTEVVCHNCHAIRTAERRNGKSVSTETTVSESNVCSEEQDNLQDS